MRLTLGCITFSFQAVTMRSQQHSHRGLYYITLHYIALHCITLYCNILYYSTITYVTIALHLRYIHAAVALRLRNVCSALAWRYRRRRATTLPRFACSLLGLCPRKTRELPTHRCIGCVCRIVISRFILVYVNIVFAQHLNHQY